MRNRWGANPAGLFYARLPFSNDESSHMTQIDVWESSLRRDGRLANMTAALEYVCRSIPAGKDNHETRKQIADAIIACAGRQSRRSISRTPAFVRSES